MARITVSDCLENVDNRFELVLLASKRARQLAQNHLDPTVSWNDDSAPVVALREIAAGNINRDTLNHQQAQTMQADDIEKALLDYL